MQVLKTLPGLSPGFESLEAHQIRTIFDGAFLIMYISTSFDVPVMSLSAPNSFLDSFHSSQKF